MTVKIDFEQRFCVQPGGRGKPDTVVCSRPPVSDDGTRCTQSTDVNGVSVCNNYRQDGGGGTPCPTAQVLRLLHENKK